MNEAELILELEKMKALIDFFHAHALKIRVPSFALFEQLMVAYLRVCRALFEKKIDFSALPDSCVLSFPDAEIAQINQSMAKIFPGHFLMIAKPPKALMESLCPFCKTRMRISIQHPVYLVVCGVRTCPQRPATLVLPSLGLTVPMKQTETSQGQRS